jgi:hypothetical protein
MAWLVAIAAIAAIAAIDVLMVLAILACRRGLVWGPVCLGLVFAGVGVYSLSVPEVGLLYLGGCVAEFAAAREFRRWRRTEGTPPDGWRHWAVFVAVVGCAFPLLISMLMLTQLLEQYLLAGGGYV